MRYLREDRGKLVRDGASQRFGGALPDALRSDEHASTPLLSVRVISSRMASMVSLLATSPGGRDARLVAAIGSLSSICPRSTTSMLSLPLGSGLLPDASANRRPKSGCLGSVTSITPPSAGFWKGVSTNALVDASKVGADQIAAPEGPTSWVPVEFIMPGLGSAVIVCRFHNSFPVKASNVTRLPRKLQQA